jgi:hypothetical protein
VKTVKLFKHTTILEANFNRELFTCHRLHLNVAGKEIISNQIASLIKKLIRSERKTPISLKWKEETESIVNVISGNLSNQLINNETEDIQLDVASDETESFTTGKLDNRNEDVTKEQKNQCFEGEENIACKEGRLHDTQEDSESKENGHEAITVSSKRPRRPPVTRKDNFFLTSTNKI